PEQRDIGGPELIDELMLELAAQLDRFEIRNAQWRPADALPEFTQALDALFRRVAGDESRVDGANRDACNPVGMKVRLGQGLIDTPLVCAQRPTSLQHQRDAFERGALSSRIHHRYEPFALTSSRVSIVPRCGPYERLPKYGSLFKPGPGLALLRPGYT